ncbi:MAG: DUF2442 domain-containing protein [Candidatus Electrothrix sp. AUS1_2]|nr:DUF2442 domain-containing protein [Candidatus Electrothrix sp. AUS1_2]
MFSPLKNAALFKAVRVEQGGWAVSWNDEMDLSEFELWSHIIIDTVKSGG